MKKIFLTLFLLSCYCQADVMDRLAQGLSKISETFEGTKKVSSKEFEDFKKKYSYLFDQVPVAWHMKLFETMKQGKAGDSINTYKNLIDKGVTNEEFATRIFDISVPGEDSWVSISIRNNLIFAALNIVKGLDFTVYSRSGYVFYSNPKKMLGGRSGVNYTVVDLKGVADSSEQKKIKAELANQYKIHLMPKEDNLLEAIEKLAQAIQTDPELGKLLSQFKVKANRKLEGRGPGDAKLYMPMIVIYPAEGQKNVQKLLDKLLIIFKGFKGMDITPRFNVKVNDLIYYAQSDADYKDPNSGYYKEWVLDYFDPATNYALFKKDFTGIEQDYHLKVNNPQ